MLSRRARLNVKPNIGGAAAKKEAPPAAAPATAAATEPKESLPSPPGPAAAPNVVENPPQEIAAPPISIPDVERPSYMELAPAVFDAPPAPVIPVSEPVFVVPALPSPATATIRSPIRSPPLGSPPRYTELKPFSMLSPQAQKAATGRQRLLSTCSTMSTMSKASSKKDRPRFSGKEVLDPSKMRMGDLIYWNPKTEAKLDRAKLDNCETSSVVSQDADRPSAPQVKIDAAGKIVLDHTSLTLDERATQSVWNVINEDRFTGGAVNSLSFRRKNFRRGIIWNEKETDLFYEVLRCTGPDFGLMHDFFPKRTRNELKSKYNREERHSWDRINETLSKPAILEDSLYDRVAAASAEIDEDERLKKEAKESAKEAASDARRASREDSPESTHDKRVAGKKPKPQKGVIDWEEDEADLEGEAEVMLIELIAEDKQKLSAATTAKEEKKRKRKEWEKKAATRPRSCTTKKNQSYLDGEEDDAPGPSGTTRRSPSEEEDVDVETLDESPKAAPGLTEVEKEEEEAKKPPVKKKRLSKKAQQLLAETLAEARASGDAGEGT